MHLDSEEEGKLLMLHGHKNKSGGSYNLCWPFVILQQGGAQGPDHTGWNPMPCGRQNNGP